MPQTKKQPTSKINNTRKQFLLCARKLQDWGPQFTISKEHMFTKKEFDPSKLNHALSQGASPKIVKLLETIRELDSSDLKTHGKLFKHFIFSDIDEGNYGARMIISSLIANGFTNMIPDLKSILKPTGDSAKKTFVYLSSKPVEINGRDATFDGYVQAYDKSGRPLKIDDEKNIGLTGPKNYRPTMKKYVTDSFNDSSNNYGDHIRFIVLDKKFKEGLDLFDVKYAHLMEAMPPSQTTQAEGRGTRNCGQKNLEFKSDEGWSLHVYHYYLRLPKNFAAGHGWTEQYEEMIKKFSDSDDRTELLTNLFTKLSQKASIDRALSRALTQQYEKTGGMTLRSGFNYELPANKIIDQEQSTPYQEQAIVPYQPQKPEAVVPYQPQKPEEIITRNEVPFNELALRPQHDQLTAWNDVKDTATTLAGHAWEGTKHYAPKVASALGAAAATGASGAVSGASKLASGIIHYGPTAASAVGNAAVAGVSGLAHGVVKGVQYGAPVVASAWNKTKKALSNLTNWTRKRSPRSPRKSPKLEVQLKQKIRPVTDEQLASLNINDPPLTEFQKNIARLFGHADLPKLPIESECSRPKTDGVEQKRKRATLNMTQDFLRRYVTPKERSTPKMVTNGLLLWHSTGSGKTCTATAIASNFEEAGYVVIYVCPGSLKSEIKKNVWDTVICHGRNLKMHPNLQDIKDQYDPCWLGGPMSYKTFTNLIQGLAGKGGGNQDLMRKLHAFDAKQGISPQQRRADPFYKTLIIIDEAQKLYSNELAALEQPHMPTVESYLHNSYAKNQADHAYHGARVVLMTATPISKSPFELFQLLNLLRPKSDALPLTDAEFKVSSIVDDKGETNNAAVMEKLQGYISFLDLSTNRTRFAQKVHHVVEVPISGTFDPILPPYDKKAVEETKKKLVQTKLNACKGTKTACRKQVKDDPEVLAMDAQMKRPKTRKYDKTKNFTQLGALQECANKYLQGAPKVNFYPSNIDVGEFAGFKFMDGPSGLGYYALDAEPAAKVADLVVESIDDVRAHVESKLGSKTTVDTDFVASPTEFGFFNGWTYRDGTRGKGFYRTIYRTETFVASDNDRGSIAGWIFRKGINGIGYYAVSIGQAIKAEIAKRLKHAFGY